MPVSCRIDTGLGSSGSNSVWLTLMPVPTIVRSNLSEESMCSISTPTIFLSSAYMSFVHFILASMPWRANVSVSASATTSESRNCSSTGRNVGASTVEKVRLSPVALSHLWPLCPRPAVCCSAHITSPWTYFASRASSFVDVVFSMRYIIVVIVSLVRGAIY